MVKAVKISKQHAIGGGRGCERVPNNSKVSVFPSHKFLEMEK